METIGFKNVMETGGMRFECEAGDTGSFVSFALTDASDASAALVRTEPYRFVLLAADLMEHGPYSKSGPVVVIGKSGRAERADELRAAIAAIMAATDEHRTVFSFLVELTIQLMYGRPERFGVALTGTGGETKNASSFGLLCTGFNGTRRPHGMILPSNVSDFSEESRLIGWFKDMPPLLYRDLERMPEPILETLFMPRPSLKWTLVESRMKQDDVPRTSALNRELVRTLSEPEYAHAPILRSFETKGGPKTLL